MATSVLRIGAGLSTWVICEVELNRMIARVLMFFLLCITIELVPGRSNAESEVNANPAISGNMHSDRDGGVLQYIQIPRNTDNIGEVAEKYNNAIPGDGDEILYQLLLLKDVLSKVEDEGPEKWGDVVDLTLDAMALTDQKYSDLKGLINLMLLSKHSTSAMKSHLATADQLYAKGNYAGAEREYTEFFVQEYLAGADMDTIDPLENYANSLYYQGKFRQVIDAFSGNMTNWAHPEIAIILANSLYDTDNFEAALGMLSNVKTELSGRSIYSQLLSRIDEELAFNAAKKKNDPRRKWFLRKARDALNPLHGVKPQIDYIEEELKRNSDIGLPYVGKQPMGWVWDDVKARLASLLSPELMSTIADPHEMTPAMHEYVHRYIDKNLDEVDRARKLFRLFHGNGYLRVTGKYDWKLRPRLNGIITRTAKAVFEETRADGMSDADYPRGLPYRFGDCSSTANLFVAMARDIGLKAYHVRVLSMLGNGDPLEHEAAGIITHDGRLILIDLGLYGSFDVPFSRYRVLDDVQAMAYQLTNARTSEYTKLLDAILVLDPINEEALVSAANAHPDIARLYLDKVPEDARGYGKYQAALARVEINEGHKNSAKQILDAASTNIKESSAIELALGELSGDNPDIALPHLMNARRLDDKYGVGSEHTSNLIAKIHLDKCDFKQAESALQQALKDTYNANAPGINRELGAIAWHEENYEAALWRYLDALKPLPEDALEEVVKQANAIDKAEITEAYLQVVRDWAKDWDRIPDIEDVLSRQANQFKDIALPRMAMFEIAGGAAGGASLSDVIDNCPVYEYELMPLLRLVQVHENTEDGVNQMVAVLNRQDKLHLSDDFVNELFNFYSSIKMAKLGPQVLEPLIQKAEKPAGLWFKIAGKSNNAGLYAQCVHEYDQAEQAGYTELDQVWNNRAVCQENLKEYPAAEAGFRRALGAAKDTAYQVFYRRNLARALSKEDKFAEADKEFDTLLNGYPLDSNTVINLFDHYARKKEVLKAIEQLEPLIQKAKKPAGLWYTLADKSLNSGCYVQCVHEYDQAEQAGYTELDKVLNNRAVCQEILKEYPAAEAGFRRALGAARETADQVLYRRNIARVLSKEGKYTEADKEFDDLLNGYPLDSNTAINLVDHYARKKEALKAIERLEPLIQKAEKPADLWYALAGKSLDFGFYAQCTHEYDQAEQAGYTVLDQVLNNRAVCQENLKEYPAAEAGFRRALSSAKEASDQVLYRRNLARVLSEDGKFAEADKEFDNLLNGYPLDSNTVIYVFDHYARMKEALKAIEQLEPLIRKAEKPAGLWYALAGKSLDFGFYAQCTHEYDQAEQAGYAVLDQVLNNRAVCQENLKEYPAAEAGFRRALSSAREASDQVLYRRNLARVLSEDGKFAEADKEFTELLSKYPIDTLVIGTVMEQFSHHDEFAHVFEFLQSKIGTQAGAFELRKALISQLALYKMDTLCNSLANALAKEHPIDSDVWKLAGDCAGIANEADAAELAYRSALEIQQDNFAAYDALFKQYLNLEQWDKAAGIIENEQLTGNNPPGRKALLKARLLYEQGKDIDAGHQLDQLTDRIDEIVLHRIVYAPTAEAAERIMKEWRLMSPNDVNLDWFTYHLEIQRQDYTKAREALDRARAHGLNDEPYYFSLVILSALRGDDQGVASLNNIVEHAIAPDLAMELRGIASFSQGLNDAARSEFEGAVKNRWLDGFYRPYLASIYIDAGVDSRKISEITANSLLRTHAWSIEAEADILRQDWHAAEVSLGRFGNPWHAQQERHILDFLIAHGKHDEVEAKTIYSLYLEGKPFFEPWYLRIYYGYSFALLNEVRKTAHELGIENKWTSNAVAVVK